MKTKLLFFLTLSLLVSCSNNSSSVKTDPVFQLPPETQTGANTFGVTIKGKVYVPRDPTGFNVGPSGKGLKYKGSTIDPWSEIVIVDGASAVGFKMVIHFKDIMINNLGLLPLMASNFQEGIDSSLVDHNYL